MTIDRSVIMSTSLDMSSLSTDWYKNIKVVNSK